MSKPLRGFEALPGGGTLITGEATQLFALLTMRQGLKLEALGMKLTRGPKVTTILRKRYGFKGNREKLAQQLDRLIAQYELMLKRPGGE